MSIIMHVYNKHDEDTEGFDISEIVHDISYTTSIMAQPGRLTFTVEKDDNLYMTVGSMVRFWHNGNPVFQGYIFTLGTDSTNCYSVTAYDQMRYLKNADNFLISDETLTQVFDRVCNACGIKEHKTKGIFDESIKIKEKFLPETSYFDVLDYAINWTNSYAITHEVEKSLEKKPKSVPEIRVGSVVYFKGGTVSQMAWEDVEMKTIPAQWAKITQILTNANAKRPYHLVGSETINNVYGWVKAEDVDFKNEEESDESETNEDISEKVDVFYYLRDNFGTLELKELKYDLTFDDLGVDKHDIIILGDESLLNDYQYEVDIDRDTFNEFYFMYNPKDKNQSATNKQVQEKQIVGAIQAGTTISKTGTKLDETIVGKDTIPKWGLLRKFVTVNDISNKDLLAEYMKLNVEHFNQPSRSLNLNAIGYDGLYAGSAFILSLKKLDINYPVYIISATHNYNGDEHTMELEINTSSAMEVFC